MTMTVRNEKNPAGRPGDDMAAFLARLHSDLAYLAGNTPGASVPLWMAVKEIAALEAIGWGS